MQEKQIIIDNLLVRYLVSDPIADNKQTILILHGWRHNVDIWQDVIKNLSQNYNVYAIDFPGFGKSQTPPPSFKLNDYTSLVIKLIKKLDLDHISLIGHSFGGKVAIAVASQDTRLVKKLILIDSAGIPHNRKGTSAAKIIAKTVKPIFSLPILKNLRPKIYRAIGAEDYVATPQLRSVFVNIVEQNIMADLPKVKQPTLLIWGENDTATPVMDAKIMAEKIPNTKLVILENAGHNSFIDQPHEVIKAITNFLEVNK